MSLKALTLIVLLIFGVSLCLASEEILPLNQVEPGMRGFGKTVFSGREIEKFEFEVLEIMPNFRAKRDLILVKLLGDKVEHTGVAAGMSGSPVYIDGKLIGALAYRFGVFSKEPIAGITPIEQMLEIFEREKVREQELAQKRGFNELYFDVATAVREFNLTDFIPPQLQKPKSQDAASNRVTPLEIPLLFSGFENGSMHVPSEVFSGLGFKVMNYGATFSEGEEVFIEPLEPGSAFSVVIVDGDFGIQATGTVTYRDGDKIMGFGHPFFDFGAVDLPMGKAKILTTLSSLMASTKISALTEVTGTLHQDRSTGVMGVRGESPNMIPVQLTFRSKLQDKTEFSFRIAEDRSLYSITPLVFSIVLSNALESARLSRGGQTLQLDGSIKLLGHEPIKLQNYYAGSGSSTLVTDASQATGEIAAILGTILTNNFEAPRIEHVELNFEALLKRLSATVEKIEVDRTIVRPGEEMNLSVYLREFQGKEHKVQQRIQIPEEVTSRRLALYVGSGDRLTKLEVRASPRKFKPQNFSQLVEQLEKRRKNNVLFFQIRERDKGLLVEGEELPG
ncbi:hypothetical protein GWO43_01440, partial [candidate division KSB1 bacterium]|nr:hypothetical protein [candidate division KSB1 bacterium]NIR69386.1 hypothetical protein [candidate division KSB1 bacterium]NIS22736.1 hypothetical protein [candidate division KSB1 bacterium]NIT69582.1 hypothetical protein [candidate division KSB1 bacterium]NIU23244.1 hypothetical protein [candidate division KSB1 bacterium]